MTVLTLYVDANARPQGHRHLLARPLGIFCCAKALGLGTHFGAKAPECLGGMVTGQIDTCITPKMVEQERSDLNAVFTVILCELNPKKTGLFGPGKVLRGRRPPPPPPQL